MARRRPKSFAWRCKVRRVESNQAYFERVMADMMGRPGAPPPPVDSPSGGGDDGGMEARIAKLEQDIAVIKSNYSTKADVSDAKTDIIKWTVGAILVSQLLPAIPAVLRGFGLMP